MFSYLLHTSYKTDANLKFILTDSVVRSRLFTEASSLRAGLKREACWGVPQFETKKTSRVSYHKVRGELFGEHSCRLENRDRRGPCNKCITQSIKIKAIA